jgi:hypothetical protein
MSAANAVQFYGIDSVMEAYRNKQTPAFAVVAGKLLMFTYDGTDEDGYRKPTMQEGTQVLLHFLSSMYQGSTAVYILKVYDGLKENEKIRPSTEYSTAFNFKLSEPVVGNGMIPYQGGRAYGQNLLLDEIQKLNARIDLLQAGEIDDEDDEDETIEEAIIGVIKDPDKLKQHVTAWKEILGVPSVQPQTIGSIVPVPFHKVNESTGTAKPQPKELPKQSQQVTTEQEKIWQRIADAIDIMALHDEHIVEHFETLAAIAKNNPEQFKKLLSMLELYK